MRRTTISASKVATMGLEYTRTWVGLPVLWDDGMGVLHAGVLEWSEGDRFPRVRFADGTWARLDYTVTILEGE